MAKQRRRLRPPAAPNSGDPLGALPSDLGVRSVTVKLNAEERKMLGRCRRALADAEGDTYPTASHVLRLALGSLCHALTGHPPNGEEEVKP